MGWHRANVSPGEQGGEVKPAGAAAAESSSLNYMFRAELNLQQREEEKKKPGLESKRFSMDEYFIVTL